MPDDALPTLKTHKADFWLATSRGAMGYCPNCGEGKLFRRYLKQVDHCPVCAEAYGDIRADDGPAWLTIVIVGHILAPILLTIIPDSDWPLWVHMLVWPGLSAALTLLILPRAKGVFIALLWRMGRKKIFS